MTSFRATIAFAILILAHNLVGQEPAKPAAKPPTLAKQFAALKFRNIGPFRGGRSNAVCGVIGDSQTYYMGSTGGGVWKTTDAGITWTNISDGQFKSGSVGAIAVASSDPNVIYVGMGEHGSERGAEHEIFRAERSPLTVQAMKSAAIHHTPHNADATPNSSGEPKTNATTA